MPSSDSFIATAAKQQLGFNSFFQLVEATIALLSRGCVTGYAEALAEYADWAKLQPERGDPDAPPDYLEREGIAPD